MTQKLIEDQKKSCNLTTIDCKELTWSATSVHETNLLRLRMSQPVFSPTRYSVWDEMQDERKTSRSQEVSVNSCNKEPSSSSRTGRLGKQKKFKHVHLKKARVSMLSRLMTKRDDLLLFFIQKQHITTFKYVMKPVRSTLMMTYCVKKIKNPLLFMTRIMIR